MLEFFTVYSDHDGSNRSIVSSLLAVVAMVVGALALCKVVLMAAEWYAGRIRNSMKVNEAGNTTNTSSNKSTGKGGKASNEGEVDVGTTHVAAIKQQPAPVPTTKTSPSVAPSTTPAPVAPVVSKKKTEVVVKEEKTAKQAAATTTTKPTVVAEDVDDMDALLDSALDQTLEHDALLEDALLEADAPVQAGQPESDESSEEEEEEGSDGLMDAAFDELDEADTLLDEALMDVQTGKAPPATVAPKKGAPSTTTSKIEEEEDGLIAEMRRNKEAKRKAAAAASKVSK